MTRGKGPFRKAIEDFLQTFDFGEVMHAWLETIVSKIELDALKVYSDVVNSLDIEKQLPDYFKPSSIQARYKPKITLIGELLLMGGGIILGIILGATEPVRREFSYLSDNIIRSNRLDAGIGFQVARRTPSLLDDIVKGLRDLGYSNDIISGLDAITRPVLNPAELETLRRRENISGDDYVNEMLAQGYTFERIEQISALYNRIPDVPDLIRFAVREAFSEDIIAKYGYYEGFPEEIVQWAEKQGLNREWVLRYWAAHWNPLSPQIAFQMLQRLRPGQTNTPFTDDDLDTVLRIADYPPHYRNWLKEVSYNPLTRVDVRRMYETGDLDEDGVYNAYRDDGYNDKNARLLTNFTIKYNKQTQKGLSQSKILSAYTKGMISQSDCKDKLTNIGVSIQDAEFYISLADYDIAQDQSDIMLSLARDLFVNGVIDEGELSGRLGNLNLPAERMQALQELWAVQREAKMNFPSRSELDDFYRRDIIGETDYREYLKKNGYRYQEIDLYVQRINAIIEEDARDLAEVTQTEQDRLSLSKLSTRYQKDVADMNVKVAELKLSIANIKVAIPNLESDEDVFTAKQRILEIQATIADLNRQKSELRSDYEGARMT